MNERESETSPLIADEVEVLQKSPSSGHKKATSKSEIVEPVKRSDAFSFLLLGFLYFVQGLPLGFFREALVLILTERGADFAQLSQLSLVRYPFAFKFLFAPIVDTYFIKKFGKRKTHLVPILVLSGLTHILLSFPIEELVAFIKIKQLVVIGFLMVATMAMEDVVVDGWVTSLISPENWALAGSFQRISTKFVFPSLTKIVGFLGGFVSFNLLVPLNSVKFCNQYIFDIPRDKPLVTLEDFFFGCGLLICTVGVTLIFYKEKEVPDEHRTTFREIFYTFKKFLANPNLRTVIIVFLLYMINQSPTMIVFEPNMIKKGLTKETITNIRTAATPIFLAVAIFAGYYNQKHRAELKLFTIFYILATIVCALPLYILNTYDKDNTLQSTWIALIIFYIGYGSVDWGYGSTISSFVFHITPEALASTFITSMFCIKNYGEYWPETIALALNQMISYNYIIGFGVIFGLFFIPILVKYLIPLQKKTMADFGLVLEKRPITDEDPI